MPQSTRFEHANATLRAEPLNESDGPIRLVWLHGWGQSRAAMRPLAESLGTLGESWILDLPGHGDAPNPPSAYAPADYAALVAAWLATQPRCPTVVLGHSFGFRVAVHLAANPQVPLLGIVSLAGAGIPRELSPKQKFRRKLIKLAMKIAKTLRPVLGEGLANTLRQRFGSRDYQAVADGLRPTFLAVVNDNVAKLCPKLTVPALLIYGSADTETPPSMGRSFQSLIPQAYVYELPHQTHYSLLAGGRHVVAPLVRSFIEGLKR